LFKPSRVKNDAGVKNPRMPALSAALPIFAKITLLFLKAYNRAGASCSWHSNTLLSMPEYIKLVSIATERNGFLYRETYKMAASHEDERSALPKHNDHVESDQNAENRRRLTMI
jgi:hypothetical protein